MKKNLYQDYELEAMIGTENASDYDLDAIRDELTEIASDGNRYWKELDADEVNAVIASHDLTLDEQVTSSPNSEIIANWKNDGVYRDWYAVESMDGQGVRKMLFVGTLDEAMADVTHRIADRAEFYSNVFYNVALIPSDDAYKFFAGLWKDLHASRMSVQQAADALGVNRQRVHQLIKSGKLSAAKVGNAWIVDGASVDARIASMSPRKYTNAEWARLGHDIALLHRAWVDAEFGGTGASRAELAGSYGRMAYVLAEEPDILRRRAESYGGSDLAEWVVDVMPTVDWADLMEDFLD